MKERTTEIIGLPGHSTVPNAVSKVVVKKSDVLRRC